MVPGHDEAPPRRGEYLLFEPVHDDRPQGPWVARRDGALQLEALEVLPLGSSWNRPGIRRFTHPRLVSLIDRFEVDGSSAQVTELVLGVSLEHVLTVLGRRSISIPLSVVVHWVDQLLEGLLHLEQASSEAGVPLRLRHGDVSAARVQVDVWGNLKLADYELLQAQKASNDLRTGGSAVTEVPFPNTDGLEFVNLAHEILTLHPASDESADRPDAPGLGARIRLWSLEAAVPPSGVQERWRELRFHLPAPDPEAAADWLRRSVPDLEAQTMARLERVRELTERYRPAEKLAITEPDPHPVTWTPPEPLEPSVMTMPGILLEPGRVAASRVDSIRPRPKSRSRSRSASRTSSSSSRRRRSRKLAFSALVAMAALLSAFAAYRLFSHSVEVPAPSVRIRAEAPLPLEPLRAEPEVRSAPVPEPTRKARPDGLEAARKPTREPVGEGRPRKAPRRAASRAGPSQAPAEAVSEPTQASEGDAVRVVQAVRAALAAPEDKVAYEEALQALRRSTARLPADRRSPVEAAIQRAEFSWRTPDLSRALERLRQARQPPSTAAEMP